MNPEYRRLTPALLLSLLVHVLLLSLTFGGQGSWLPGFGFPWQVRRIEAPDLRVTVVPAPVIAGERAATPAAESLRKPRVEEPLAGESAPTPSVSLAPSPPRAGAATLPEGSLRAEVAARPDADPSPVVATVAAPAQRALRADRPGDGTHPPIPAPAVIAVARTDEATWVVPVTPPMPPPVVEAEPSASSPETAMPSLQEADEAAGARADQETRAEVVERDVLDASRQEEQRRAEQLEVERQQAARQVADRQEAARQETARAEAARHEAARAEKARLEVERQEAERQAAILQEAARKETIGQEAARQEAARQEAARQEAARQEAARQEAARQEAARQEAARQEAARQEAARQEARHGRKRHGRKRHGRKRHGRKRHGRKRHGLEVAREAAARREATLRAIGRQLDEEAARREAQPAAARPQPSSSSARRYRLWGRTDPNAELILYAEAWSRKIQLNMTFDMVRDAALQPHADPLVTVAIRSDGSVESVTFVRSSGAAALDEAIRRVVHSQTPYQAFPPGLAREFDVIEIRRTWYFDVAIRLY